MCLVVINGYFSWFFASSCIIPFVIGHRWLEYMLLHVLCYNLTKFSWHVTGVPYCFLNVCTDTKCKTITVVQKYTGVNKPRVINDPFGQPTVQEGILDCYLKVGTDRRTDNLCENDDHCRQGLCLATWINSKWNLYTHNSFLGGHLKALFDAT